MLSTKRFPFLSIFFVPFTIPLTHSHARTHARFMSNKRNNDLFLKRKKKKKNNQDERRRGRRLNSLKGNKNEADLRKGSIQKENVYLNLEKKKKIFQDLK